jgi:hypothetical protein
MQFRQIQTPEDGHIGPKHVVLSEMGKKIICCITDGFDIYTLFNMSCNRMFKYRIYDLQVHYILHLVSLYCHLVELSTD